MEPRARSLLTLLRQVAYRPQGGRGVVELDTVDALGLIREALWNVSFVMLQQSLQGSGYVTRTDGIRALRIPADPPLVILAVGYLDEWTGRAGTLLYIECGRYRASLALVGDAVRVVVGNDVVTYPMAIGELALASGSSGYLDATPRQRTSANRDQPAA